MLLRAALGFSLFETLLLAGVLLAWADRVAGGRLLAAFLLAIAVWITGNELPNWFGPEYETLALHLLATAPLTSALFFHFCVVFCRAPLGPGWVRAAYALGGGAALVSQVMLPAHFVDHPYVGRLGWAEPAAWITSISWVLLGIAGVTVLLTSLARAKPPARAQIAAVTASCLWGLLCLSGYGLALTFWPVYPFPLLGLPLYPLVLVYGILRYGVFVANVWAGRALVWTLLLALGGAIVALMPLLLPFESRWLSGLAVAASCLALNGPVKHFVQRLIYPGGEVSAQDLATWRLALGEADSLDSLAARASDLLGRRLGIAVQVHLREGQAQTQDMQDAQATAAAEGPRPPSLSMRREPEGWTAAWHDWDAAPPGQRHVAQWFATVLAEAALRVEQAQQLAVRERERQLQARLAELGALAATVAHDIRNPLNIISMAVALAPKETRSEVSTQVGRISHLTNDLLDYAKPWKLQRERVDLKPLAQALAAREPGLQLGAGWTEAVPANVDPRRIEQALVNLVENARGASPNGCTLEAEQGAGLLRLHVCDNGPGVPHDLRDRLFQPFASRSTGGTGLGLAIVARIAQAHGGRALLTERPPWRTCFTLEIPDE